MAFLTEVLTKAGLHWPTSAKDLIAYIFVTWAVSFIALSVYRVTLHPLAGFPGPKLAGATYLPEVYHDLFRWGRYTHEIRCMHEVYGPIVRISPNELHCNDPEFINDIYTSSKHKRNKTQHFSDGGTPSLRQSIPVIEDHDTHRKRRAAVSKHFSRRNVVEIEPVVHREAHRLCEKLLAYPTPFQTQSAYSCFTTDVITEYLFGESTGLLDQPDWEPNFSWSVTATLGVTHILRHFWFLPLGKLMDLAPLPVVKLVSKDMWRLMHEFKVSIPERIRRTQTLRPTTTTNKNTIVSTFTDSNLPASEKTVERIAQDTIGMMIGGTETVAGTLSHMTYHLLSNPETMAKLHAELATVATDPQNLPAWDVLEKLPYFSAVLLECLRLFLGASFRLARISPDQDIIYKGNWTRADGNIEVQHRIPRGYAIGMSAGITHFDESIFPEAELFVPERWLNEKGEKRKDLQQYLLSFGKGSRMCIGIELAYCELYVCGAALLLRAIPHMELYKTTREDVAYDHDEFVAKPKAGSVGVRVRIV